MRCQACGRRWDEDARFCGRCGGALGRHRRDAPGRGEPEVALPDRRLARTIVLAGVGLLLATALGSVVLAGAGPGTATGPTGEGPVHVPTASERAEVTTRAAGRPPRPADCGDHLQELPHAIRRPSLHLGALEWRDGRLCAPLGPSDRAVPGPGRRCPPGELVCAVP